MAKDETKQENAETNEEDTEARFSVLNPKLEIAAYTFENDTTFRAGQPIPLSDEDHAKYSSEKHDGIQVVVRAG